MSTAKAANVTKYDAGGSGDNIVDDGYIKTVEKIWADNYTIAFTDTVCTLSIAKLPVNKKIMGVDVIIETSASQTSGAIALGFSTDASVDSLIEEVIVTHNATTSCLSFPQGGVVGSAVASTQPGGKLSGFQKVTAGTQTTVAIKLDAWTATTGTIKTIVRYT